MNKHEEAKLKKELQPYLPEHEPIHLMHVYTSTNGMNRRFKIKAVAFFETTQSHHIVDVTYKVAQLINRNVHKADGALKIGGCGFDTAGHIAWEIKKALYGNTASRSDDYRLL